MSELRFIFSHAAALLLVAASAAALGRPLTRSLSFHGSMERGVFATSIGLGVFANAVHLLGLVGAIRPATILLLIAAPFAIFLLRGEQERKPPLLPDRLSLDAVLLLLFGLAPALLLALYPPTEFDATMYHLPYAKAFATRHALVFLPTLRFPVFPQLVEMLFTAALSVYDDVSAQLIHFLCLALTALALLAWSRRVATARAGIWAAAAWLGSPIVLAEGASAYVDVGLALFCTLCLYAWSAWVDTNDERWLFWSAVFAGFAASTKYQGFFFVFAIPAAVLIVKRGAGGRLALRYLAVSMLVLSPFYGRIVAETGNPLFPFFSGWFGTTAWSEPVDPTPSGGVLGALGRLFLPGNAHPRRTIYSPFLLLLAPLLTAAVITDRRRRLLLALALAFGTCWYLSNPAPRYLFPVVPACTLTAAAFLDGFLRKRGMPRKIPERAFTAALALLLILPGTAWAWRKVWRQGPLPVTALGRERYLDERVDVHSALSALNSRFGASYTVYCLHCESAAYFAEGTFLGDYFGPYRFSRVQAVLGDGRLLYDTLRQMGVTHLLVSQQGGTVRMPDDSSFQMLFEPMPAPPGVLLFALRAPPEEAAERPETPVSSRAFPATHP
ncbi:MAG TPA: glycosyltransferase family 39 protein [Thermoanaerobaculia bacterium]